MSPFTVLPCTIQDAPSLSKVRVSAFWTDASWSQIWRGKSLSYVISQASRRTPHTMLQDRTHRRYQKAIDTKTGAVVGNVRWILPDNLPDAKDIWQEAKIPDVREDERSEAEREFRVADLDFDHSFDVLDEKFEQTKERLMKGQGYVLLDQLAVDPQYWRQGVGAMLVKSGIREFERIGLDIFIHGKKSGLGLYRKLGFELVEEVILDDSEFGGSGEYGAYFLVRKSPQKS